MEKTIIHESLRKILGREKYIFLALLLFNALLLFFCTKLSPLYDSNYWSDVNIYFTLGKGIMHGLVPFRDLFDHKGPLIFFIYGLGYLISNESFLGVYAIESLFYLLGASAIYLLARHYLNRIYSFLASVCFSLAAIFYSGVGGAAEDFILMLQAVGLLYFIRYFAIDKPLDNNPIYMFIQGMLVGIVFFIKLNLVAFWFFLLLAVFVNLIYEKRYANLLRNSLAFVLGVLTVIAPLFLYYIANSAFDDLWKGYIEFNSLYSGLQLQVDLVLIKKIIIRFAKLNLYSPFFFGCSSIGLLIFVALPHFLKNIFAKVGLLLTFFSLAVIIFMSPVIMEYYYISFSVFIIFPLIVLLYFVSRYVNPARKGYVFVIVAVIGLIAGCWNKQFFQESKRMLIDREQPETLENVFGNIIKREKNPTLLTLGIDASQTIFTKTGIVPNVKYFFSPNIYFEVYPDVRNSQTRYIEDQTVQFIVLRSSALYYDYFRRMKALSDNYMIVAQFVDDENSTYFLYKRRD